MKHLLSIQLGSILILMSLFGLSLWPVLAAPTAGEITFSAQELIGRPTDSSITINVLPDSTINLYYEYGTTSGVYTDLTPTYSATGGSLFEVVINGLSPDTRYYYRMQYQKPGDIWITRSEHSFHTQRTHGSAFTFTVTSDSHLTNVGDYSLYRQTLQNVNNDHPDFHLDLGDAFGMDTISNQTQAYQKYLTQRSYLDALGHSAPIFLAVGNHENEEGWNLDDTADPANSLPIMSTNARKRYFLNPIPDSFYSGNLDTHPAIQGDQLHEDYYAWEWGDALFVVIDPFWYTLTKPYPGSIGGEKNDESLIGDRWDWTLGEAQFNWLKQTLEGSTATHKFVFTHHMTGGSEDYVRGGAVPAHLVEWGGYNIDGTTWGYRTERPGWGWLPTHQLMVATGVTIFFHGHDHEFAREDRDGIVYQLVPMPSDTTYGYGFDLYHETDPYAVRVLPNTGHLRVAVSPAEVQVEYVRAYKSGEGNNGEVAYTYTIPAIVNPHAPQAVADAVLTSEDTQTSIEVLTNDLDADGDELSVIDLTNPAHGTASILNGTTILYTPAVEYSGADSLTYTIGDGKGKTDTAVVDLTIEAVNDPPVISEGASLDMIMSEDSSPTPFNLILHATDAESSNLLTWSIASPASHGLAVASGIGPTQIVDYASVSDYYGNDSFVVQVTDGTSIDTITINITIQSINDAPVCADIASMQVTEDIPSEVGPSCYDVESDPLIYQIADQPKNGSASISNGMLRYAPNANFNGNDSFTYLANDGSANSNPAAVPISIIPVNDPPVADGQNLETLEDSTFPILLTGSDVDGDPITFSVISGPNHGVLSGSAPDLTYTPASNYYGADSFTFVTNDGQLDSSTAAISIAVTSVNDAPILAAIGDKTVDEGTVLTFTATASDIDNDPLTFSLTGEPSGSSIDPTSGIFSWTPSESQGPGSYLMSIQASDALTSDSETITITVNEVNLPPTVTNPGAQSSIEDDIISLQIQASDADLPTQNLSYAASGLPSGLNIGLTTGLISGTISTGASSASPYTVTISISDGQLEEIQNFTWVVNPNTAPNSPMLLAPVDGAVGVPISPALTVTVSDIDTDQLQVDFYGRLAPSEYQLN